MERQGDLRGPSAILLVLLMVAVLAGVGAALVGLGRLTPSPEPSVPPTRGPASSRSPAPSPGSPTPSLDSEPTATIAAVVDPGAILAAMGDAVPITEDGLPVGTVTLDSAVYRPRIQGVDPPSGSRWLRISVTFQATATLTVDPTRWSAVDTRDRRFGWTGAAAPDPPLGGGSVEAGTSLSGYVVIAVPATVDIRTVVLQDADGDDMVAFVIE